VTWQLHLGSCLDPVSGLASLADDSVDVTITDPPYEAEAHTKGRRTKRDAGSNAIGVVEEPLPFAAITEWERLSMAREIARVTRRWILVFCQVEAASLWARALEAGGAAYVRTMVWIKPDAQPQLTGDRPGMGYESIVVAHRSGRKKWNGGGRVGVFDFNKNGKHGASGTDRAPHPTTKPQLLMLELVELFSDPGELVLDVCAGSGSTGVACNRLGRDFIGWELDRNYYDIARRRLNGDEAKPRVEQPGLFDAKGA
jgi:site-specific DNA-methyltransferase (adenine-specific)